MNEENIINALNSYDGTQPSLEKTVSVLATEVGPDWADQIFEKLGNLPVELKEKLDHVFNYYASLTAWNEAQSYLEQTESLDPEIMDERLPILKHWLEFFGEPGQDLYQQLENRYQSQSNPPSESDVSSADSGDENEFSETDVSVEEPAPISEDITGSEEMNDLAVDTDSSPAVSPAENNENTDVADEVVDQENDLPDVEDIPHSADKEFVEQDEVVFDDNTPEGFTIHKAQNEIALLDDLQSWLAARCVQLGNIENFAYPYYGMLVDLMRQVVKDIQAVLDLENQEIVAQYYPDGLETLIRKKEAVESDIQTAVENCESDTTALIEEGMDLNKVKKALGDLDNSTEKEYLGPAPDGFELLDDKPIDEEAVKEQYEQLEEDAQKNVQKQDISVTNEKSSSQNEKNGVQRKLSFSLKPKKG